MIEPKINKNTFSYLWGTDFILFFAVVENSSRLWAETAHKTQESDRQLFTKNPNAIQSWLSYYVNCKESKEVLEILL